MNPLLFEIAASETWRTRGAILTAVLLLLLVQKELVVAFGDARYDKLRRALNVAILPMAFAFAILVVTTVISLVATPQ